MTTVIFSHGKESGPNGRKIEALAQVARNAGFAVIIPDYRDLMAPQARAERLSGIATALPDAPVLVGSSMGGYASLMASTCLPACAGLFLLAPAIGLEGYPVPDPPCPNCPVEIVHGWHDDVVPVENVIGWARRNGCTLHLVDDDHRLGVQIDHLAPLFGAFLLQVAATRTAAPPCSPMLPT